MNQEEYEKRIKELEEENKALTERINKLSIQIQVERNNMRNMKDKIREDSKPRFILNGSETYFVSGAVSYPEGVKVIKINLPYEEESSHEM